MWTSHIDETILGRRNRTNNPFTISLITSYIGYLHVLFLKPLYIKLFVRDLHVRCIGQEGHVSVHAIQSTPDAIQHNEQESKCDCQPVVSSKFTPVHSLRHPIVHCPQQPMASFLAVSCGDGDASRDYSASDWYREWLGAPGGVLGQIWSALLAGCYICVLVYCAGLH